MKQLSIFLNGRHVGTVSNARSGAISLQYSQDWLSLEGAFPISRSLPLDEKPHRGGPIIAYLENLLPDNQIIRERIAAKVNASNIDAFSMLEKIGGDCVGALQFLPNNTITPALSKIEGQSVTEAEIAQTLRDLKTAPLGMKKDNDFRISIAGAQEKTAFLKLNNQWHLPIGTTPTTHIFKTQIGQLPNGINLQDSVENEFFCMQFCQNMGLNIANVTIAQFEDIKTLIIERFDRRWHADDKLIRVPQEDFCQALATPPSQKYQTDGGPDMTQCMNLLKSSNHPTADQSDFLKAQILFWLLGATDGHAKNYSIFLQPGGFAMTPFYDILSAQKAVDEGQITSKHMKLALSIGNQKHYRINDIAIRHFLQSAKAADFGIAYAERILTNVQSNIDPAIEKTLQALPKDFPASLSDSLINGIHHRQNSLHLGLEILNEEY